MAHGLVARRRAGQRRHLELAVAQARVLEPGQRHARQRLAQQIMIETRQPLCAGDEVVEPRLAHDAHRHVLAAERQVEVGRGVLLLVPVGLEVFQQEVAIADLAHFGRESEALAQVLAMLLDEAEAVGHVGFWQDAAAALAQVVGPAVLDAPEIDLSRNLPLDQAEEIVAVIDELRALRQPAGAHVIEAQRPIRSLRAVLDAQQLVGGPIGEDLRAENAVFHE